MRPGTSNLDSYERYRIAILSQPPKTSSRSGKFCAIELKLRLLILSGPAEELKGEELGTRILGCHLLVN